MIPQYYTYKDLYLEYLLGKRVHACLTHRFSNDTMFIGDNERMKRLYSSMEKLYALLETLRELFNDNPLWKCDTLITSQVYIPQIIDNDIEKLYIDYFNQLYFCLKTTIDYIDNSCKVDLVYLKEQCEASYSIGNENNNTGCIKGDYNNDYNNDYFVEKCEHHIIYSDKLIICDNYYDIIRDSSDDNRVTLNTIVDLSVGDEVELGKHQKDHNESIVHTIISIDNPDVYLDSLTAEERDYTKLAKINEAEYEIVSNVTVLFTQKTYDQYYYILDYEFIVADNTSVIITDVNGIKYYDVILTSLIDGGQTGLEMAIPGIPVEEIASFEVTNYITSSCYK